MNRRWITASLVILAGVAGSLGLWAAQQKLDEQQADSSRYMPEFSLPDLQGVNRHSKEWQGKVMLVNFWATWCPPCREEMPHFVDAQHKYGEQGFQMVGIAIDDPVKVKEFVEEYKINFPVVIGGMNEMQLSVRMGNRFEGLPYSALYNRQGEVVMTRAGVLTSQELDDAIQPLLEKNG